MAAPLSGVGQQQQVPLSQSLQPNSTDQTRDVRQKNQAPREDEIQTRGAALGQSKESSPDNTQFNLNSVDLASASGKERGSLIDITV